MPNMGRKTFAARSFTVVGSMLWNNLPNYIKDSNNVDEIKKKLKTFSFVNKNF